MARFFEDLPDTSPIRLEDAFIGGRNSPFQMHAKAGRGKKITYTDIQVGIFLWKIIKIFAEPLSVSVVLQR